MLLPTMVSQIVSSTACGFLSEFVLRASTGFALSLSRVFRLILGVSADEENTDQFPKSDTFRRGHFSATPSLLLVQA